VDTAFGASARHWSAVMAVQLSEAAAKEIKTIIQQQELPSEKTRLRVGVKGGGCSGFSYLLDLTEEDPAETDEQMESHGVPILVDNKSLLYLDGVEIDFRDEVMGRGFVFKNPNATSSCGCGSSFNV
jgi:iron-sulfur cluster assembly protein